jgi:uncharacterized protein DUF6445
MQDDFLTQFGIVTVPDQVAKFQERLPNILVVDDFYSNPDAVRQFALDQKYEPDNRYFRGSRTESKYLFPFLKERFEKMLGAKITHWLDHKYNGVFQFCPAGTEVVFHSDHQTFAAVVYLTPDAPLATGTSFYRSKETKLRKPPTQADAWATGTTVVELEEKTYKDKLTNPEHWELVDQIANVYNRLVIWDSKMIHAASGYFGTDIRDSRLFHLYFFDAEKA